MKFFILNKWCGGHFCNELVKDLNENEMKMLQHHALNNFWDKMIE